MIWYNCNKTKYKHMKTCVFAQRLYVQPFCEKKCFRADGSMGNGAFDNMQYAVNQQEMVAFCLI